MLPKSSALIGIMTLAAAVSGCVTRGEAMSVAQGGQALAKAGRTAFAEFRATSEATYEIQLLNHVFGKAPLPDGQVREQLQRFQNSLQLREELFAALSVLYDAFHDLASYDARVEVSGAAGQLTNAVIALAGNHRSPIRGGPQASQLISVVAGEIANAIQTGSLTRANERFAALLDELAAVLATDRDSLAAAQGTLQILLSHNAEALLDLGLAEPAVTDDMLQRAGLKSRPEAMLELRRISILYAPVGKLVRQRLWAQLQLDELRAGVGTAADADVLNASIQSLDGRIQTASATLRRDWTTSALPFDVVAAADERLAKLDVVARGIANHRLRRSIQLTNSIADDLLATIKRLQLAHANAAEFSAADLQELLTSVANVTRALREYVEAVRAAQADEAAAADELRKARTAEFVKWLETIGVQVPPVLAIPS